MPAARLVERLVVRLAEQDREPDRFMVTQRPDRRIQRQRRIAASAAILTRRNAADAADLYLAPIPGSGTEVDADMAGEAGRG